MLNQQQESVTNSFSSRKSLKWSTIISTLLTHIYFCYSLVSWMENWACQMARCKHDHFVIPVTNSIVLYLTYLQNTAANSRTFATVGFAYFVIFLRSMIMSIQLLLKFLRQFHPENSSHWLKSCRSKQICLLASGILPISTQYLHLARLIKLKCVSQITIRNRLI